MSDAKVKISVETAAATASLEKLGRSFSAMGDNASKGVKEAGAAATHGSASAKLMGDRIGETVKSFIAFEFAKKIVQMADATMRSAGAMENLSAATRANAKEYVENTKKAKESLDQIILTTSGFMSTLADYAAEGLGYWATIFGADQDADKRARDDLANKMNDALALVRTNNAELKKLEDERLNAGTKEELASIDARAEALTNRRDNNQAIYEAQQKSFNAANKTIAVNEAESEKIRAAKEDRDLLSLRIAAASTQRAALKLQHDQDIVEADGNAKKILLINAGYQKSLTAIAKEELASRMAFQRDFDTYIEGATARISAMHTALIADQDTRERSILEASIDKRSQATQDGYDKEVAIVQAAYKAKTITYAQYLATLGELDAKRNEEQLQNALTDVDQRNKLDEDQLRRQEARRDTIVEYSRSSYEQQMKDIAEAYFDIFEIREEARQKEMMAVADSLASGLINEKEAARQRSAISKWYMENRERNELTNAAKLQEIGIDRLKDLEDQAKTELQKNYELKDKLLEVSEDKVAIIKEEYEKKAKLAQIEIEDASARSKYLAGLEKKRVKEVGEVEKEAAEASAKVWQDKLSTVAGALGGFSQLMATYNMKDKQRRQEYKAVAMAEVAINTYVAASKAWAQTGIFGAIAAAGVIAAGLAQERQIAAQKFATGGIVQGPSSGDTVPVRANGGEMILTQAQQGQLFQMANGQGGGGGMVITYAPTITGGNTQDISKMLMENHAVFGRYIKGVVSDPAFNRSQRAL